MHLKKGNYGQVKLGWVNLGTVQVRTGHFWTGQVSSGQVGTGSVVTVEDWNSQFGTVLVLTSQDGTD